MTSCSPTKIIPNSLPTRRLTASANVTHAGWVSMSTRGGLGHTAFDAAKAISIIGSRVCTVDLKDVTSPGQHETCRFGDGVVPLEDCVRELVAIGYQGPICVEHNAGGHDPGRDIFESRQLLATWLKEHGAQQ